MGAGLSVVAVLSCSWLQGWIGGGLQGDLWLLLSVLVVFLFISFLSPGSLFGGWWLTEVALSSGVLPPLPICGCFLFLEAHFSSKQHAEWLCDFQGAIWGGHTLPLSSQASSGLESVL